MTVRGANYPRKENDFYSTPAETTRVLLDNVSFDQRVCDPACGKRAIVDVLKEYGYAAVGSDLTQGYDFLKDKFRWPGADIVANPPFGIGGRTALTFIERALKVMRPRQGKVAMLLPVDFDSGSTRAHVFGECSTFAEKIVLTNRIRWFNGKSGSINHAWYIWQSNYSDLPRLRYAKQNYNSDEKYVLT